VGKKLKNIAPNVLRLGVRFLAYRNIQVYHNANSQKLTLRCCYKLAAVDYRKTRIEALNKKN
jgi:hypothetical protein